MKAALSSWRTWMKRMRSWRVRKASMIPFMPSPGRPKTMSIPQAMRPSTSRSDAVSVMGLQLAFCLALQSTSSQLLRRLQVFAQIRQGFAGEGRGGGVAALRFLFELRDVLGVVFHHVARELPVERRAGEALELLG